MADGTNCSHPLNLGRYIEEFSCTGDSENRILKEMRLSFPSGHSSFSAYTMIYCAVSCLPIYSKKGILSMKCYSIEFSLFRFICRHVWHGEDQDCSSTSCNTFWSWWLGLRVWAEFLIINTIGPMSWRAPCWELPLRYSLRISLPIWVADANRRIGAQRDTSWERIRQTTVQSLLETRSMHLIWIWHRPSLRGKPKKIEYLNYKLMINSFSLSQRFKGQLEILSWLFKFKFVYILSLLIVWGSSDLMATLDWL